MVCWQIWQWITECENFKSIRFLKVENIYCVKQDLFAIVVFKGPIHMHTAAMVDKEVFSATLQFFNNNNNNNNNNRLI